MKLIPRLAYGTVTVALTTALAVPGVARAEFYAGVSLGRAGIASNINGFEFDEDDTGSKLIFGYVFDLPVIDISLETSYVDLGAPRQDLTGAQIEVSGLDAFAVAGIDFGVVGFFAKAGMIVWDADTSLASARVSDDGSDAAYGIGARFNVASLFIRAEYERFDIDATDDVDLFSVGLVWRF